MCSLSDGGTSCTCMQSIAAIILGKPATAQKPHFVASNVSGVLGNFMYLPILRDMAFNTWDSTPEKLLWEMLALVATVRWNDPDARKCKGDRSFAIQEIAWLLLVTGSKSALSSSRICVYYFFFSHSKNVDASRKDLLSPSPFVVSMPPPCYNDRSHVCVKLCQLIHDFQTC